MVVGSSGFRGGGFCGRGVDFGASRAGDLCEDWHWREVTPSCWGDFESLFESRGGPSYCWCMAWRRGGEVSVGSVRGEVIGAKKAEMRRRVAVGETVGLLGYGGSELVGWCSVAERSSYRELRGRGGGVDEEGVWSLACFFVRREFRGRGVSGLLLGSAIELASLRGGLVLEAYPVLPESPSYHFMGVVPLFESAGFVHAGRAGTRRHIMRLPLKPSL